MPAAHEIFDVIRAGDRARLEALLAAEPQAVNARSDRGHTPVLIAQYHHKTDLVQVLLAAGPELDIFDAASVGRTERVAELLDADPSLLNTYSGDGFFPLLLAAFFDHAATARALLAGGADARQAARNPTKMSALHAAVARGNGGLVRDLLAHGADPKQQDGAGKSAIGLAADQPNANELLKILKGAG